MPQQPAGPYTALIKVTITLPQAAAAGAADPGRAFWDGLQAQAKARSRSLRLTPSTEVASADPPEFSTEKDIPAAEQVLRDRLPGLLQAGIAPLLRPAASAASLESQPLRITVERIAYGSLLVWLKVIGLEKLAEPIAQSLPLLTDLLALYLPQAMNELLVEPDGPALALAATAEVVMHNAPATKPGFKETAASGLGEILRLLQTASLSLLTPVLLILGIGYVVFEAMNARIAAADRQFVEYQVALAAALGESRKALTEESKTFLTTRAETLAAERRALDTEREALRLAMLRLILEGKAAAPAPVPASPCCPPPRPRCGGPAPPRRTCTPQPPLAGAGR